MNFEDVLSTTEAAKLWEISPTTVKLYCLGTKDRPPKFKKNECRKSGNVWLVTRAAMIRVFGEMPQ